MTATQPGSATATSGGMPRGWIDPIATYGAVGDGTTDDRAAIQSAITAAKTSGGTVYLDPTKTFAISSALDLSNNTKAFRLTGGGAAAHVNTGMPTIKFTGASGNVLNCHSIFGVEIDHIRIQPSNASYNGTAGNDMIDVDGGPLFADCTNFHIHHIATSQVGGASPRSAIRLNKAIIGRVSHNHFGGNATNQIRVADPGGGYVVTVEIDHNTYNNSTDAHVLLGSGDAEAITIRGETFEAGTNTPGVKGSGLQLYDFLLERCWFGDAGAPLAGGWITNLTTVSSQSPGTIRNNYFADAGGTGVHIGGGVNFTGNWVIAGNHFEGNTAFDVAAGGCSLNVKDNYFNNSTIFASLRPTNLTATNNACSGVTEVKQLRDSANARLSLGQRSGGPATLPAGSTDGTEQLVLAATSGALQALGEKAGLYSYFSGGNLFAVALQAPTNLASREVQIVTGTTPTPIVRASDAKLAFFNTAPVVKPATTGTATGFTAGAGAAVKDDSTFTGGIGATAYRISDIVLALKQLGLLTP